MSESKRKRKPAGNAVPPIVAIGASAGGLASFERFFKACPPDIGAAFVLVPHLDPTRHSLMVDLVSKYTKMSVVQVSDGIKVDANHVYVIPPNKYMSLSDGQLHLEKAISERGIRMAIDSFFRSIAQTEGERAIGIVMSGTGTDGTQGLKAIKGNGGLAVVQRPESAQHDGMPVSAIATGMVDYVLTPEEMPERLASYINHSYVAIGAQQDADGTDAAAHGTAFDHILAAILARTKHDFRQYKTGTLLRRIERRISLLQLHDMDAYLDVLRRDGQEIRRLFDDLLIRITQFFRDADSWAAVEKVAVYEIVNGCKKDETIRVWVPACSSGEEAYTLAMVFLDVAERLNKSINLQLFATDVDDRALSFARNAIYPESIAADIPDHLLSAYFTREEHSYVVSKRVRECIVFAQQDVANDPPFSRMHMISCRNLLIYLKPDVQKKVLSIFSFSLRKDGYLFLGGSETIGRASDLFAPIDKKHRVYQRIKSAPRVEPLGNRTLPSFETPDQDDHVRDPEKLGTTQLVQSVRNQLLACYAPAAVVVDDHFEVALVQGQVDSFLSIPNGVLTRDLLQMTRRGLRMKTRKLIRRCLATGTTCSDTARVAELSGWVRITARPLHQTGMANTLCIVAYEQINKEGEPEIAPVEAPDSDGSTDEKIITHLENELKATREDLQGTIEELETSNEELKTANEEALSMNEELQSTNEELETSKEELQSLNEELNTVNSELQENLDAKEKANADLTNLLSSTEIATIFLDTNAQIRRFTPSARTLFNLIATDIGRPLDDISNALVEKSDHHADTCRVIATRKPFESEVETNDGRWFIRRVSPYRSSEGHVNGAVLTFTDVTRLKNAEREKQSGETLYRSLFDDNPSLFFLLDAAHVIDSVNAFGAEQLGTTSEALAGRAFPTLFLQPDRVSRALAAASRNPGRPQQWEAQIQPGTEVMWIRGIARFVTAHRPQMFVVCHDISMERSLAGSSATALSESASGRLLPRNHFHVVLDRILRNRGHGDDDAALIQIEFAVSQPGDANAASAQLLHERIAALIEQCVRRRDPATHLFGFRYAIVTEHCDVDQTNRVCESLASALRADNEGQSAQMSYVIAVVQFDGETADSRELLELADRGIDIAKSDGPGTVVRVNELDPERLNQSGTPERWLELIDSAGADGVSITAQPIIGGAVDDPEQVGLELGARFDNMPAEYEADAMFAISQRYDLGGSLGERVVRRLLEDLSAQRAALRRLELLLLPDYIAQSLVDDRGAALLAGLRENNLPLQKLVVTIPEHVVDMARQPVSELIRELKSAGVKICISDVGAAQGPLFYVEQDWPIDFLKFDLQRHERQLGVAMMRTLLSALQCATQQSGIRTIVQYPENRLVSDELESLGVRLRLPTTQRRAPLLSDQVAGSGATKGRD